MWRGRLSVALDALETEADYERAPMERLSPVETTNVQLPTGDRLQIPTGAETLRMKSYLIMCRNTHRDFAEFAELVDSMETQTAAVVLAAMDRYYCGQRSKNQWVATQLVRRLADPQPSDEHDTTMSGTEAEADWAKVRQRCLSVAVAMLGGGEVTLAPETRDAPRDAVSATTHPATPKPAQETAPDDRPVEFWPTAAIRAALETDDLTVWQRIVVAIKRDPYGRTAQTGRGSAGNCPAIRCFQGTIRGTQPRPRTPGSQRARRGRPPRSGCC